MINPKRFFISYSTGASVSLAIQRVSDGFYLQSSDGSFGATPDTLSMTETMTSGYSLVEDRAVWNNGLYDLVFFHSTTAISGYEFTVAQDQIMTSIALVALSAKNAVSQVSQALGLIQNTISELGVKIDLLQGQVNDTSFQSRRSSGN